MIDERLVYAKTAKGVAEVNTRSGAVPLTARRVLIMIDGKRTVAELAPLAKPGEVATIITQLETQGLVYPAHAGTPTTPPAAAPPAEGGDEAGEDRLVASFDTIKRRAARELSDRLGPDAEVMAVRIEHARTPDDLRQRLHEAERLVAGMLGDAQAQEFVRALRRR
jgi:hypothetical protein